MIETTDEAVTYLEMVARRESGDLAEAALIVTRTLRQATQTLADHAQTAGVPGVREGDVSDEALRRLAEKLYGEPALGIYAGLCRVAEEVAEEARRERDREWAAALDPANVGTDYGAFLADPERARALLKERETLAVEEARREERERIEGIVREEWGSLKTYQILMGAEAVLERIERRIKGEER